MAEKKTIINVRGIITKVADSNYHFSKEEYEKLTRAILEVVDNFGCEFSGGLELQDETEYLLSTKANRNWLKKSIMQANDEEE